MSRVKVKMKKKIEAMAEFPPKKMDFFRHAYLEAYKEKCSEDIVGLAVMELDCGCHRVVAVTSSGDQGGPMVSFSNYKTKPGYIRVCRICLEDSTARRVVRQAIMWFLPMLDEKTRRRIFTKVYGETGGIKSGYWLYEAEKTMSEA